MQAIFYCQACGKGNNNNGIKSFVPEKQMVFKCFKALIPLIYNDGYYFQVFPEQELAESRSRLVNYYKYLGSIGWQVMIPFKVVGLI